jgi:hypothetical protein
MHSFKLTFRFIRMTALSYQRTALIKVPKIPYPPLGRDAHREKWCNYPLQSENTKAHTQCLSKALNNVSLITYDLTWSLFNRGDQGHTLNAEFVQEAEDAYNRLRTWYDKFPNCLGTSNATPHVLSLQSAILFPGQSNHLS